MTLEHRSANSITDRLNVEHTRRIQNEKAVDVPSPQIVKTSQDDIEDNEDEEEAVVEDEKEQIPIVDHAFEDLPRKAQELLMNGIGFKYLSSSRNHPFNHRQSAFGVGHHQGGGHHGQHSRTNSRINQILSQKRFLESSNRHPWNEEPMKASRSNVIYL